MQMALPLSSSYFSRQPHTDRFHPSEARSSAPRGISTQPCVRETAYERRGCYRGSHADQCRAYTRMTSEAQGKLRRSTFRVVIGRCDHQRHALSCRNTQTTNRDVLQSKAVKNTRNARESQHLAEVACIADTILAWYRRLLARKFEEIRHSEEGASKRTNHRRGVSSSVWDGISQNRRILFRNLSNFRRDAPQRRCTSRAGD
jgi:hypothetical protein